MRYEAQKQILLYDELGKIDWEEGKHVQLAIMLYRHAIVVACSERGRRTARFANGEFPYFTYIEIVNKDGIWGGKGHGVVPILPDGRLLMVVEQRPILARYPDHERVVTLDGGLAFDLGEFGSLEFPGGGIAPGESITLGILRELGEETEVPDQKVTLYRRLQPIFQFGSDVASANFYAVAQLTDLRFERFVENDGGLRVLALTEQEVRNNLDRGAISSGQAAILPWNFYIEVRTLRMHEKLRATMVGKAYLSVEEVGLKK